MKLGIVKSVQGWVGWEIGAVWDRLRPHAKSGATRNKEGLPSKRKKKVVKGPPPPFSAPASNLALCAQGIKAFVFAPRGSPALDWCHCEASMTLDRDALKPPWIDWGARAAAGVRTRRACGSNQGHFAAHSFCPLFLLCFAPEHGHYGPPGFLPPTCHDTGQPPPAAPMPPRSPPAGERVPCEPPLRYAAARWGRARARECRGPAPS